MHSTNRLRDGLYDGTAIGICTVPNRKQWDHVTSSDVEWQWWSFVFAKAERWQVSEVDARAERLLREAAQGTWQRPVVLLSSSSFRGSTSFSSCPSSTPTQCHSSSICFQWHSDEWAWSTRGSATAWLQFNVIIDIIYRPNTRRSLQTKKRTYPGITLRQIFFSILFLNCAAARWPANYTVSQKTVHFVSVRTSSKFHEF